MIARKFTVMIFCGRKNLIRFVKDLDVMKKFYEEDLNEIVRLVLFVFINLLKPICKHLLGKDTSFLG